MMVNARPVFFRLVAACLFAISVSAQADTIRCGAALIREGATVVEIREKCGEPVTVERSTETVYGRRADGSTYPSGVVTVDYWYYDFGSRRFPVRMTVRGGIAEKIERLSRHQ